MELNWNQRSGHKKNICHHMLKLSTQLPNRSFHVVERTRIFKMSKNDKCTCKACKNTVFHCQICKFMGFLLSSSSWLRKLPKGICEKQFKSTSLFSPPWTKFITRQLKDFKLINPSLRKRGSDKEISMHLNTNRNKLKPKTFSMKKNVQIGSYGNNWMVEICLGASGLVSVDKISGN